MKLRSLAAHFVPDFIKEVIRSNKRRAEQKKFNLLDVRGCDTVNLKSCEDVSLPRIFQSQDAESKWELSKQNIENFDIPDSTGGVNPGDRKALFYLLTYFQPTKVLEVGTHIGASTVHIATAIKHYRKQNKLSPKLTTLDIRDVNSTFEKPWLKYGTQHAPLEMIEKIDCEGFVKFKTAKSLKFLEQSIQKFDFIFLDGDHSAYTIYQEVPLALKVLNRDGVILLHDYFPENKPLWDNDHKISGPYKAVERLINEGANLKVLPLGELPWRTKKESNITSLALLLRKGK